MRCAHPALANGVDQGLADIGKRTEKRIANSIVQCTNEGEELNSVNLAATTVVYINRIIQDTRQQIEKSHQYVRQRGHTTVQCPTVSVPRWQQLPVFPFLLYTVLFHAKICRRRPSELQSLLGFLNGSPSHKSNRISSGPAEPNHVTV